MKRFALTSLFVFGLASVVSAQAPQPTSWVLRVYTVGGATLLSTTPLVIGAGGFVCNQPQPTGVTVNPNKVVINDPTNAADVACVYTDPGAGPLLSLPVGSYEGSLSAVAAGVASTETLPHFLFTRTAPVLPPAVPTGLRIIR